MLIDIRLLTFITVARTKSYTKSAEILNITQPAVSQHIKYLEEEYEVKLIKKSGKTFNLTSEGLILVKYAEEIQSLYRMLKMKLKNSSSIIKSYNLGASMTIGAFTLPSLLADYKILNPNINFLLQVNNTKEILEKLLTRRLDFALIEGLFDKNKFKFKKLTDDELVLAVSPKHDFTTKHELTIEDVLKGNLILREKGSGTRVAFENRLVETGYNTNNLNAYMEIGSIQAIKSLVESNLGYSIISREAIKKELSQGTIKELYIKDFRIIREFNFIFFHEEDYINEFINFCQDHLNK